MTVTETEYIQRELDRISNQQDVILTKLDAISKILTTRESEIDNLKVKVEKQEIEVEKLKTFRTISSTIFLVIQAIIGFLLVIFK